MNNNERDRQAAQSAVDLRRRFGSEREVSVITGIPTRTLQKHRLFGRGLPFYRLEGRVLYDLDEVETIIRSSTSSGAAA